MDASTLPYVWLIGFPILWVSLSLVLAWASGWTALAARYSASKDIRGAWGDDYYLRAARIGPVSYRSCLNFRICERGLRIAVLFPFRIGHPPLFTPWDAFHTITTRRGFFTSYVEVQIGWPVVAEMVLPIWMIDHLPVEAKAPQPK